MITNVAPARLDEFSSPFAMAPDDSQSRLLTVYLSVWRYAWDWAMAEWKLQERLARDARCGELPTMQWLEERWQSLDKSRLPPAPDSIGAMAVSKLANTYMLARMTGRELPKPSPPQIYGTFRVAADDCYLSPDRTRIVIGDTADIAVTRMPEDIEWKEVHYVSVRKLVSDGWSGLLVGWSPSFCDSGLHNITYGELPEGSIDDNVILDTEEGEI